LGKIGKDASDRQSPLDNALRGKGALRAVAFAQDPKTLAITGASQIPLQ
jgi:hypothetical protein